MIGSNSRELSIVLKLQDQVSSELKGVQGKLESMGPTFKKMAGYGTAAAAGIGFMGKKMLDVAGDAEMVQGRFNAVFQDTQDDATQWVNELAVQYGRAESTMQATASAVGGQLQMVASELPSDEISEMSRNLSEQAIAMSAYYKNLTSSEDAANALSAALAGQTDRLTQMGYSVGVQSEQFQNMRKELGFTKDEMNSTKEALVIYNLIMEQNEMVMDAYSETQDNYNEKVQQAREQVKRMSESIGESLIPIMSDLFEKITPVIEKIALWIEENPRLTKVLIIATAAVAGLVAILGVLGLVVIAVTSGLAALSLPVVVVAAVITAALIPVIMLLIKHWEVLRNATITVWQAIKNAVMGAVDFIWDYLLPLLPGGAIIKGIVENWDTIKEYLATALKNIVGVFSWAKDKIMSFLDPIIETAKKAIDLARRAKEMAGGAISGARDRVSSVIDRVTPFADGGIVTRPTMGLVGEAGPEAVIPLNKAGGFGGINVTITGNSFMGEEDMAEKVGDKIIQIIKQTTKL